MTLTEDAEQEIVYAYDGGTMYRLGDLKDNFRVKNSANDGVAALASGAFPVSRDLSGVQPVWLAYASSCFFDRTGEGETVAISGTPVTSPYASTLTRLKTKWTRNASSDFLESVRYYTDRLWTVHGATPAPAPFNQGYVLAELTCFAPSNLNGVMVPGGFVFDEYALVPPSRSSTNASLKRIKVFTTVFHVMSAESPSLVSHFVPTITSRVYVDDHRFLADGTASVNYLVSTHEWLPVTNKMVLQALNVAKRGTATASMRLPAPSALRSRMMLIFLASALFLPPIFYLLSRSKSLQLKHDI